MTVDDLPDLVGERLMIGLPGSLLRADDVRLFRDTGAGALILYRRNFESPEQLRTLLPGLVGERLMIGLPGPELRDADVDLFRDTRAAGLILYRRNFESPAQLRTLLTRLEEALGRRLLVASDHEGGRIVMLGAGTTMFPDNLAVGTAGEEAFAAKQGLFEARELR